MLKQRIITAVILAVIIIWAVLKLPPPAFGLLLLVVMLLGAWEWSGLMGLERIETQLGYVALVLVSTLVLWLPMNNAAFVGILLISVVTAWCFALLWLRWYATHIECRNRTVWLGFAGVIVLAAPCMALMVLREAYGTEYVLLLLLLIWSADIGAYFVGRRWGQRKLAPNISPGKTWEGTLGAGIAALLLALIGVATLQIGARWPLFVALCVVTAGFSVIGDLFESMVKRQCGTKDSGSLLPGHGGVLDRVDSLTAAAPVFLLGLYGMQQ